MSFSLIPQGSRRMTPIALAVTAGILALPACATSSSSGGEDADYPTKSITLTIPYAPGGGTDTAGRLIASGLEAQLGESIIVVNKPGGGGALGVAEVAEADPDGYNLGLANDSNIALQPLLNKDLSFTNDSFEAWSLAPTTFILVAASGSKYTTLTDIIAEAKANPGTVRIAHPGTGGPNDLVARAFGLAAEIEIVPVPITGGGAEINKAVASGQVELAMTTVPVAKGFVDSGDLVIAGTMADDPAPGAEDAETLGSIGIDTALIPRTQLILIAPAGLPDGIQTAITDALQAQVDGDLGTKMTNVGYPMAFSDPAATRTSLAEVQGQYEEILSRTNAGQ